MKKKKELIIILGSLLVVILSVTLAYFTTEIFGTGKDISLDSANLKITFSSGSGNISGVNIEPGWSSGASTFTVKNESNDTYKYNIVIKDLINTFVTTGFLKYKITSTDGGYNMSDFADVPKSTDATDTILAYSVEIAKGATHTYSVEFKYENSIAVDQSDDMGKKLSGTLYIENGTLPSTLAEKLLENNPTIETRTDFSTPFTTNTANTLYKATENGTDVYYFAGVDRTGYKCTYKGNEVLYFNGSSIVSVENKNQCLSSKVCKLGSQYGVGEAVTEDFCTSQGAEWVGENATWYEDESVAVNNWVKFGKNSSNQNLYWRIIRTNSDGGVRLLYHGTSTTATDAYIGLSAFNTSTNSPKYVGYMYGNTDATPEEARTNANDSAIKAYIDNWYANNMTSYIKYLSTTAVYCNDRELASGASYSTTEVFYFKAHDRLDTNKTPTYDCTNNNDKFTVDASTGNGKLTYPIALMTADEIIYAGGVSTKNAPMWYYTNSSLESSTGTTKWWSLSPDHWGGYNALSWLVVGSVSSGILSNGIVDNSCGVRPTVSLKACVKYSTGNGTSETPYEIVYN